MPPLVNRVIMYYLGSSDTLRNTVFCPYFLSSFLFSLVFIHTFIECHVPRYVRGSSRRLDLIRHSRGLVVQLRSQPPELNYLTSNIYHFTNYKYTKHSMTTRDST